MCCRPCPVPSTGRIGMEAACRRVTLSRQPHSCSASAPRADHDAVLARGQEPQQRQRHQPGGGALHVRVPHAEHRHTVFWRAMSHPDLGRRSHCTTNAVIHIWLRREVSYACVRSTSTCQQPSSLPGRLLCSRHEELLACLLEAMLLMLFHVDRNLHSQGPTTPPPHLMCRFCFCSHAPTINPTP